MALRQVDLRALGIDSRTRPQQALELMRTLPVMQNDYTYYCQRWERPEQGMPEEPTPQWAEWFAHYVLVDHWPAAEELIATGPEPVREGYRQFVLILRQCGMLGRSTGEHALAQRRVAPHPAPEQQEPEDQGELAGYSAELARRRQVAEQLVQRNEGQRQKRKKQR